MPPLTVTQLVAGVCLLVFLGVWAFYQRLPPGVGWRCDTRPASRVRLLWDITWRDQRGASHQAQQIFDEMLALIAQAKQLVLLDMFLFNDFGATAVGKTPGSAPSASPRSLSRELTDALIRRRRQQPDLTILFITDPINTVYGGLVSPEIQRLEAAGIRVVITDLDRLRDSNPLYSTFWRLLIRPLGNPRGGVLPNPFGDGKVPLRAYLRLFNLKANHRKLLIVDEGNQFTGLVSSANPHDASSAHTNMAVRFSGPAVADLYRSELALLALCGQPAPRVSVDLAGVRGGQVDGQIAVLTERAIKRAALDAIRASQPGDRVRLLMFYLADRQVIRALKQAAARRVRVEVLLDPNKDAFGFRKIGIPNRPVARELRGAGVRIRWCDTRGEQCHCKLLLVEPCNGPARLISGSANFTRRNLDNYNLETDVLLTLDRDSPLLAELDNVLTTLWENQGGIHFSMPYGAYDSELRLKGVLYRAMEFTGLSSF